MVAQRGRRSVLTENRSVKAKSKSTANKSGRSKIKTTITAADSQLNSFDNPDLVHQFSKLFISLNKMNEEDFKRIAEEILEQRSNKCSKNLENVELLFKANEELVTPLLALCPRFDMVLSAMIVDHFGLRVKHVKAANMAEWTEQDAKNVGYT